MCVYWPGEGLWQGAKTRAVALYETGRSDWKICKSCSKYVYRIWDSCEMCSWVDWTFQCQGRSTPRASAEPIIVYCSHGPAYRRGEEWSTLVNVMYVINYLYTNKNSPSATRMLHMQIYTSNNVLRKKKLTGIILRLLLFQGVVFSVIFLISQ